MKNIRRKIFALLLATLPMVATAQVATKTPPEGKAYTIRSTDAAVGGGTVAYQWFRNNVPLANATNANYTVPANEAYGANTEFMRRADCGGSVVWSNAVLVSFVHDNSFTITGSTSVCANTSLMYWITNVPGTTYTWTVPSNWTITAGQGTNIITVTTASNSGSGTVSVTPSSTTAGYLITGTTRTRSVTVVAVTSAPAQPSTINGNATVCSGQSFHYSVTNVSGITYTWAVPSDWTITAGQGTSSITVMAGNSNGSVSVTPSTTCGGNGTARTLAVEVGITLNQPSTINGNATVCSGQSITYSVTNVAGVTYTWAVPAGWNITAGQGTNSITVTAGASGGIVSVTPSVCGSNGASRALAVTVGGAPAQPSSISGSSSVCSNGTGITYSVANVAGVTYTWTVPAGWSITTGQGSNSITATAGTAGGTVSVTPSTTCGGNGTARTLAVTIATTAPQTPSSISGNSRPCPYQTGITYSLTNYSINYTYTWSVPSDWEITSGQGTRSITATAGNTSGSVSVTASYCSRTSAAQALGVTVGSAPTQPSAITASHSPVCANQTGITYSVTNEAGVAYAWTVPAGWTITAGQGSNGITVTAGTTGGTVSVTPSNTCGGNGAARSVSVTVGGTPTQPTGIYTEVNGSMYAPAAATVCSGQTVNYTIGSSQTGVTYTWTVPADWTITSGQGTYYITATAGSSGGNVSVTPSRCNGSHTGTARTVAVVASACGASCGSGNGITLGGVCWATRNVAAVNTFAAQPDMYTQFYQWNGLTAYSAADPLTPAWNSTADNSSTWTNNPCPSGWRIPTYAEFYALFNGSAPTGGTWAIANERGNAVAGRFYGPNHAVCTMSSMAGCIFLPAGGSRSSGNGQLNQQGSTGWYWYNGQLQGGTNGVYMTFSNTSNSTDDVMYKETGTPIRCVQ